MSDTATLKSPATSASAAAARRKARLGMALSILGLALSLTGYAVLLGRHSLADRGEQAREIAPPASQAPGAPGASGPEAAPRSRTVTRSEAAAASADR